MAIIGALALTQGNALIAGGATFANTFWAGLAGFGITAGAGILDSQFVMPALLGSGNKPGAGRAPMLLQLPTFTSNPGSPRTWSYGQRVRVPAHLMFMSDKERTERSSSGKGGMQARVDVRKVYSDLAIALNDRPTNNIAALLGDGRIFYWTDRDLLYVRTSGMSAAVVNTNFLRITMSSVNELDLSSRFAGRVVYPPINTTATVSSASTGSTTITVTVSGSPGWSTNQWQGKQFVVTSGTRTGERGWIKSNTSNTLTVQYQVAIIGGARAGLTVAPQNGDEYVIANAGDVVRLQDWSPAGVNGLYQVIYIRPHSVSLASNMLLEPVESTITLATATAGTVNTPARIARSDNAVAGRRRYYAYPDTGVGGVGASATRWYIDILDQTGKPFPPSIVGGMKVNITGSLTYSNVLVRSVQAGQTLTSNYRLVFDTADTVTRPSAAVLLDTLQIAPVAGTNSPPELYTGVPEYWNGNQTTSSGIMAQHIDASEIPQFRGVSFIAFDEFSLTEFGNRVPSVEAIIDPVTFANWREAFAQVCDRVGLPASQRALGQIAAEPFDGMYVRGAVPGVTALQPLMLAKQVVTQDRDGVLHFFPISACEVVQIRNGTDYSDMGAATERDAKRPKFSMAQVERTVLPSSVGVRHQDPDNFYSEGYQHFGIRGPSGAGHETRDEVDLSNIVLTRQAARNLAGTVLRRTWINSTTYELELPASYWHVLENDVLTWTDDEAIVHAARVIKIDRGQNWIVKATCVAEDVASAYEGSPVQSGAGQEFQLDNPPADVSPLILDIPAVYDIQTDAPGIYLGVTGPLGNDFRGCAVYQSIDAGTTYQLIGSLDQRVVSGQTTTALDASGTLSWTPGTSTVTFDNVSTVQVQLEAGTLSSYTEDQVKNGKNWALVGNEIIGFTTATLDSPGVYTLSGLLRNLRDTIAEPDQDATTHAVGDRFVMLTDFLTVGKFQTYPGPADVGRTVRYKFVAPGQNIVDVTHQSVTLKARNALPFAPYASTLTWEPNDDATITMTPWTNRNVAIGSVGPYTFDDTIEEYVVRIYTDNTYATETASSPYTVTTRLTGAARLRDRWVTYPKASVISDGFTPGSSTIYYTIEQVGDYGTSRRKRFQG